MHLQMQPTLELFSKEEPEIPEDNILTPIYSSKGGPKRIHLQGPGTLRTAQKGTVHQVKGSLSQPILHGAGR